jgi:hypothetical protein
MHARTYSAFGALLYEMATGQMAFGASTNFTILQATADCEPIPPSQLNPTLPATLLRVIGKALLQNRECRYQGANEILTDLKAVEDDLESGRPPLVTTAALTDAAVMKSSSFEKREACNYFAL